MNNLVYKNDRICLASITSSQHFPITAVVRSYSSFHVHEWHVSLLKCFFIRTWPWFICFFFSIHDSGTHKHVLVVAANLCIYSLHCINSQKCITLPVFDYLNTTIQGTTYRVTSTHQWFETFYREHVHLCSDVLK